MAEKVDFFSLKNVFIYSTNYQPNKKKLRKRHKTNIHFNNIQHVHLKSPLCPQ